MKSIEKTLATLFAGPSEMAARLRAIDWAKTPLGPVSGWSPTLQTMVRFLLANRFPLLLWWGPEYVQLYNDAYIPVPGTKHPRSAGQRAEECWPEIWDVIGPLIDTPFRGGPATWVDDLELEVHRHGFTEETHFTVAYSPVPDETAPGGIGGVLATVHEITREVIQERRVVALRDLGTLAIEAKTAEEACERAAQAFGRHPRDVPFALIYLLDAAAERARLVGVAGVEPTSTAAPPIIDLHAPDGDTWPLAEVYRTEKAILIENFARWCDPVPPGPWHDPPTKAMVLPIPSNVAHRLAGFLVLGVSARLAFDLLHESFFALAVSPVATAIATARAFEEERRRAEALAELDRAKTAFFSNVSHEFRTPLTLMLGPLEEVLGSPDMSASHRESLDVAHRNSLRLVRLVNALLDFSRMEASRIDAAFEAVDVAALTSELASVFRSAVERAGLTLEVDCRAPAAAVYLDRDMWEKIVLNLLSNAFKFTFTGAIAVSLADRGDAIELAVRDTGVGIPAHVLAHVFERFHRVRGTEGRTHEGTGIGLALVSELVKLHGGRVSVESEVGVGSTFTVRIPTGAAHLPEDRVGARRKRASTAVGAEPFIEEALRWLPEVRSRTDVVGEAPETAGSARVLVADDNADMRAYIVRLLEPHWQVEAVGDGEAALAAMRRRAPDLVLSDVMMPRLDGIGLTQAIRSDPARATIPIILLSARAGEESRIDGARSGADDYLTKPFAARELVARVDVHLRLAQVRRNAEAAMQASAEHSRFLLGEAEKANRAKDEFLATVSHELRSPLQGILGWLTLLRRGGLDAAQAARALESIDRSVRLQAQLVQDILEISRIVAGKVTLDRVPLDVGSILTATAEEFAPVAAAKSIRVELRLESCGLVVGDRERLHQIFANLLTNALKFTPVGGGVTLSCQPDATHVVVTVTDTGEGIEPSFLPRLFDRFSQADSSSTRRYGGLGLGLAIVHHLVELHAGTVTAESAGRGRGATFRVRLPRDPSDASVPYPEPSRVASVPGLDGVEILLVEDDREALDAMTYALEARGARVRPARSARAAWAAFRERAPDVVVSDLSMPDEDGYSLLRRIRSSATQSPPAIALTGFTRAEDRARVLAAGFAAHVAKPIDPDWLVRVLADVLSERRLL